MAAGRPYCGRNSAGSSVAHQSSGRSAAVIGPMSAGAIYSDGNPDHVKNDPKVIAAYLGVEDDEVEEVIEEIEHIAPEGTV
jgi:hypothetical protein